MQRPAFGQGIARQFHPVHQLGIGEAGEVNGHDPVQEAVQAGIDGRFAAPGLGHRPLQPDQAQHHAQPVQKADRARRRGDHPLVAAEHRVQPGGRQHQIVPILPLHQRQVEIGPPLMQPHPLQSGPHRIAAGVMDAGQDAGDGVVHAGPGQGRHHHGHDIAEIGIGPDRGLVLQALGAPARRGGHRAGLQHGEAVAVPGPFHVHRGAVIVQGILDAPDQHGQPAGGIVGQRRKAAVTGGDVGDTPVLQRQGDHLPGSQPAFNHGLHGTVKAGLDHDHVGIGPARYQGLAQSRVGIHIDAVMASVARVQRESHAGGLGLGHGHHHHRRRLGLAQSQPVPVGRGGQGPDRGPAILDGRFEPAGQHIQRRAVDSGKRGCGAILVRRRGAHGQGLALQAQGAQAVAQPVHQVGGQGGRLDGILDPPQRRRQVGRVGRQAVQKLAQVLHRPGQAGLLQERSADLRRDHSAGRHRKAIAGQARQPMALAAAGRQAGLMGLGPGQQGGGHAPAPSRNRSTTTSSPACRS